MMVVKRWRKDGEIKDDGGKIEVKRWRKDGEIVAKR
jgi:hypothetical protein